MSRYEIAPRSRDEAMLLGTMGELIVFLGLDAPSEQNALAFRRQIEQQIKKYPSGIGILGVLAGGSTPDRGARRVLIDIFSKNSSSIHAAFVLEGTGFAVATQRSIIAAALMATRRGKTISVVSELPEAVEFLRKAMPTLKGRSSTQLIASVRRFMDSASS